MIDANISNIIFAYNQPKPILTKPIGFYHQFVLKSGKLGKWKKAPKKDFKIENDRITYLGKARFIKPIFEI